MNIFQSALVVPATLIAIFSTTIVYSVAPDRFYYQIAFFVLGLAIYLVVRRVGWQAIVSLSPIWYGISILLLILTFFIGETVRGSSRWLSLGWFNLQPSEWAKAALILFLPLFLSQKNTSLVLFFRFVIFFVIAFALVLFQPDLGSSLILGLIGLTLFLSAKIKLKYKIVSLALLLVSIPAAFPLLKPYQQDRLTSFLDPFNDPSGTGYNVIQSIIAVGSGRWLGKGLGLGSQSQLQFLPEKQTDFIFASYIEELGFVGGTVLLLVYFWLLLLILERYYQQQEPVPKMISLAIFMVFAAQIFINIGMNMGVSPVTGLPLPLLSVGGNSILLSFFLIGLLDSMVGGKKERPVFMIGQM